MLFLSFKDLAAQVGRLSGSSLDAQWHPIILVTQYSMFGACGVQVGETGCATTQPTWLFLSPALRYKPLLQEHVNGGKIIAATHKPIVQWVALIARLAGC